MLVKAENHCSAALQSAHHYIYINAVTKYNESCAAPDTSRPTLVARRVATRTYVSGRIKGHCAGDLHCSLLSTAHYRGNTPITF